MGQITKTTYIELQVEVEADYMPGSPAVMPSPSNETGTPPEAEEFDITSVRVLTERYEPAADIMSSLSSEQLEQLEAQVKEDLDEDEDY